MERIENDFIILWIEGGVIYGEYKSKVTIDIKAAIQIARDRINLANNQDYPSISFIDGLSTVTKEARDYFSKDDGIRCMKCLALITTSPISKVVGNFFLLISKPAVPTRLFTNKDDALIWLNGF